MAIDLTAILQPGETIVYRTRGRSYAATATYFGAFIPIVTLFWMLNDMMIDPEPIRWGETGPFYLILGGCLAGALLAVLVIARSAQRHHPDDLAITDRRVLFANSDWDNKLESLTLNEIEQVAWVAMVGARQLTVEGGGQAIKLPPLRDGDAATKAIADAAGLAPPPALGRFAAVDPVMFGFALATFTAYLALNQALISSGLTEGGSPLDFDIWWIRLTILLLITALAFLIGFSTGGPVTVTAMRPFVSPDLAQVLLCAGKPNRWHLRIALKWASLLYGRRLRYVAC